MHAVLRCPNGRGVGCGAPPDAVAQAGGVRLEAEQARRIGKHRARAGLGKSLPLQQIEIYQGMTPRHVGVGLTLRRPIAEIAPAVDHLLGRTAADAKLQPSTCNQIGRTGILRHVVGVLVAHVDDRGADLDTARPGADRREQRERRGQLSGEMVHPEVCPVGAQFLRGDGEVDRLQQGIGGRSRLRVRRRCPMPEREKADLLHEDAP